MKDQRDNETLFPSPIVFLNEFGDDKVKRATINDRSYFFYYNWGDANVNMINKDVASASIVLALLVPLAILVAMEIAGQVGALSYVAYAAFALALMVVTYGLEVAYASTVVGWLNTSSSPSAEIGEDFEDWVPGETEVGLFYTADKFLYEGVDDNGDVLLQKAGEDEGYRYVLTARMLRFSAELHGDENRKWPMYAPYEQNEVNPS